MSMPSTCLPLTSKTEQLALEVITLICFCSHFSLLILYMFPLGSIHRRYDIAYYCFAPLISFSTLHYCYVEISPVVESEEWSNLKDRMIFQPCQHLNYTQLAMKFHHFKYWCEQTVMQMIPHCLLKPAREYIWAFDPCNTPTKTLANYVNTSCGSRDGNISWYVHHFSPDRNISETVGWFAIRVCAEIHGLDRIAHKDFGDLLTFHSVLPAGHIF